ncbi:1-phosphatidylinositol-4,5-bisphosphate phosphodiesterase 1 [Ephemerocybe angulata]|uniref:Phosphoinositide phospholipase C n=1 Tax=Ephemerocybe angulata TaxID=980116 RepID=A0A8H6I617_9AGAR|nr:1-phosphatidylinositol-4,5-bisphosphate phosphodiesterase 1 [Tulosesus angulatus]
MSAEIVKPSALAPAIPGAPHAPDDSTTSALQIPEIVEKGTLMTKVSDKGQKRVTFRIDPDEGTILYKSRKNGIVPIEVIKELRSGKDARYYRAQYKLPEDAEARWITIIYILQGAYKTLHILADTQEAFAEWNTTLKKLYAVRQGLTAGVGNTEIRQAIWERQYWKGADEEGDQQLDFDDIERLCKRLHANLKTSEIQAFFKQADADSKGYLDFATFQKFVKLLKRRTDIEEIYERISGEYDGKFDQDTFERFLKVNQKETYSPDEFKAIWEKYSSSVTDPAKPNEPAILMTLEGFTSFLFSSDNSAFAEQGKAVWQDMTRPMAEYFISSSHNTYLVGHQLVGVSTIEGYIRALLHSCRSVELDIWEGDDEPMIYHGKTFTTKVSLRDICSAIAKYAFVTSPYPLLISAEVHCGVAQQEKIVDIMTQAFGDSLIQAPVEGRPTLTELPSPDQLKHKILLKAKNLFVVQKLTEAQAKLAAEKAVLEAEASSTSSSDEDPTKKDVVTGLKDKWNKLRGKDPNAPAGKKTIKMSFRLASLLVYTVGVKWHGIGGDGVDYAPEHIFSLSENSANKLLKASMTDLIEHDRTHLVRIYPKGTRVNSTNYEPHRYWAAGCQVVAINWQTFDMGYVMNQAMFQRNGRSGFVLKPQALRSPEGELLKKRTQHFLDVRVISAQQLPPLRDSKGQEVFDKSIPDPFVEVSLLIPDWTHSPFLPESSKIAGAKYSPPTDATATSATSARTITFKTKVVRDNGFNPVWNEHLHLPFDCVGGMTDLIFVKFTVRQKGKDDEDDEPIAIYCVPLGSLKQGYRHLPLHDSQMTQHLFSTLFVEIGVREVD